MLKQLSNKLTIKTPFLIWDRYKEQAALLN